MSATAADSSAAMRRRMLVAGLACMLGVVAPPAAFAQSSYVAYFRAVKIDNTRTVGSLLARGFDPNTIEPDRGETGMMLALREGAPGVFRLLLEHPETNVNVRAFNGDSALMIACYTGNGEAARALIERGAAVHHPGWTPLHYAAAGGHNDIAQMLMALGAPPDARSPNNTTPMMMAALGGHIMTVKVLLDAGADATLKNDHGMTAIDFARRNDHQDIVDGLIWRLRRAGKL
ncbi:MAG TPA: ankyrin repeat domain-containing protein [Noviherbaspirillum sp.]|nr:ankyrin repeat domain-containing protein [Noviherbaspirillum sp.]